MSTSNESMYLSPQGHVYWSSKGTIYQEKQRRQKNSKAQGSLLSNVDLEELRKGIIDISQFPGISDRQTRNNSRVDRRILITGNRDFRYRENNISFYECEEEHILALNALLLLRGQTLTSGRLAKGLNVPIDTMREVYRDLMECFAKARIFGTIVKGKIQYTTVKNDTLGILPEASFIDLRSTDMLRQAPRRVFKGLRTARRKPEGRLRSVISKGTESSLV